MHWVIVSSLVSRAHCVRASGCRLSLRKLLLLSHTHSMCTRVYSWQFHSSKHKQAINQARNATTDCIMLALQATNLCCAAKLRRTSHSKPQTATVICWRVSPISRPLKGSPGSERERPKAEYRMRGDGARAGQIGNRVDGHSSDHLIGSTLRQCCEVIRDGGLTTAVDGLPGAAFI